MPLSLKDKQINSLHGTNEDNIEFSDLNSDSDSSIKEPQEEKYPKKEKDEDHSKKPELNKKQILIHPLEAREHILKFFQHEKELLSIMYGRIVFHQKKNDIDEPFICKSVGSEMFFIEYLVVST